MSDTAPAAINENMEKHFIRASAEDFKKIPGSPIAYWAKKKAISAFEYENVENYFAIKKGMAIGDNARFLRRWAETSKSNINFSATSHQDTYTNKWYPCLNGGAFRRWSSNKEYIVNWGNNGDAPKTAITQKTGDHWSRYIISTDFFFSSGINWTAISSSFYSARFHSKGFAFTSASMAAFRKNEDPKILLMLVNSKVGIYFLSLLSPTLNYGIAELKKIPYIVFENKNHIKTIVDRLISISSSDWDSFETSWDFTTLPLLHPDHHHPTLAQTYANLRARWQDTTLEMQRLEEENNRIFIEAYGLQEELTPDVPLEEITLTCNPRYRYGRGKTDDDYETLLRGDTAKELISYAVGCMMGRYSLDEPGLVYAHSGNQGFDPDRYQTFPADEDGILPVMDLDWFDDDAARRLSAFIQCVWPETHLEDNLSFIAECLSPRAAESPLDTIRRYLSTTFFKDHMRTYKKRPIYWLFSSGRQKAFTCLVYLHRYHPATLSRMRSNYVTPLQGKLAARMEFLDHERQAAGTPSAQKKVQTQMDLLKKKQAELNTFDDELRHYADLKIDLDLDDGVKVNYAKFGNLLAERKGITGK
jgi:type II restriction/modification system DNA methylase subunit YeeA